MPVTIEIVNAVDVLIEMAELPAGETLAGALMRLWPEGFPGFGAVVFGGYHLFHVKHLEPDEVVSHILTDGERFTVKLVPRGVVWLGVDLGYWILMAISFAAAVALTPKALKNFNSNENSSNFAANQQNQLRPGSRVPDVFGKIRVYPDLLSQPYAVYDGKRQFITELYAVSNGYLTLSDYKLSEDGLDELYSGDATQLNPGESLPADFRIVSPNLSVSTIDLPAESETFSGVFTVTASITESAFKADADMWGSFNTGDEIFVTGGNVANVKRYTVVGKDDNTPVGTWRLRVTPAPAVNDASSSIVVYQCKGAAFSFPMTSGDYAVDATVDGLPAYYSAMPVGTTVGVVGNKTYAVILRTAKSAGYGPGGVTRYVIKIQFSYQMTVSGTKTASALYGGVAVPTDPDAGGYHNWTPWLSVPIDDATEIWTDFTFAQGLFRQKSGQPQSSQSVTATIQVRVKGGTTVTSYTQTFTAKSQAENIFTRKITGLAAADYEIRVRRASPKPESGTDTAYSDLLTLTRVAGSKVPASMVVGNVTAVLLTMDTQLHGVPRERKFNVIAQRQLRDYNANTTPLRDTRSAADAVAFTLLDQAGYSRAMIDMATLYAKFGASTFDAILSDDMSADEQVALILNAWSGYAYRRAGTIGFVRDEAQTIPRMLFNRRNKVQPEKTTMFFGQLDEPDGVEVTYSDMDQGYRQITAQYPTGALIRPKRMDAVGLITHTDAWRRAYREFLILQNRRDTVSVPVTEEGVLLAPGNMIAVTDHLTENSVSDGEVVAVAGRVLTLDRAAPAADVGKKIRLRDRRGVVVQETTVASISGLNVTIAADLTVIPPVTDTAQTLMLYEIVTPTQAVQNLWVVQRFEPTTDQTVAVIGYNYSAAIYVADTATPPPVVRVFPRTTEQSDGH